MQPGIESKISVFANRVYRHSTPERADVISFRDKILIAAFTIAGLGVLAIFVALFVNDARSWYQMTPEVPIERHQWKVLLDTPEGEPPAAALWEKAPTLDQPQITSALKMGTPSHVWLRLDFTPGQIRDARAAGVQRFRIGWLIGGYKTWVNERPILSRAANATGTEDIPIPSDLLQSSPALSLTVSLTPRPGARNLVPFTLGMREGLVTYETGANYQKLNHFINRARPLALFLGYIVFGAIFFSLWVINRRQREYLQLATFALVTAVPEVLFSDAFSGHPLRDKPAFYAYLSLIVLKAGSALALGLAFARTRLSTRWVFASMAAAIGLMSLMPSEVLSAWRQPLNQTLLPVAFAIGAAACLVQAFHLHLLRTGKGKRLSARELNLNLFAVLLLGLACVYFVQFRSDFDYVTKQLLYGFPDLLLVYFLGTLALLDYQQQSKLIEKLPISKYHRRPQLPESVSGAILVVDIKSSEHFFALSARSGEAIVPVMISQIWLAIRDCGGTILKAEGDEIIAIFDRVEVAKPLQSAFFSIDAIDDRLGQVYQEFVSRFEASHETKKPLRPRFRAAIVSGSIRPVWQGQGRERVPSWSHAGETMPFVEAARLLEIEKQLASEIPVSRTLISSAVAEPEVLDETVLRGKLIQRRKSFKGKHDRIFVADVYECLSEDTPDSRSETPRKAG